jgi:hypothetical protein
MQEQIELSPVFAPVNSYDELHRVIRTRASLMQASRSALDAATGLPDGYCGKVLSKNYGKNFGKLSLFAMLEVLGLGLIVVDDRDAIERGQTLLGRFPKRCDRHARWGNHSASAGAEKKRQTVCAAKK